MEFLGSMLFVIATIWSGYMLHEMVHFNSNEKMRKERVIKAYNNGYLAGIRSLANTMGIIDEKQNKA